MSYHDRDKWTPQEWLAAIPEGFHPIFTYPDGSEENKIPRIGELLWHNPDNADSRKNNPAMYDASQLRGDLLFFVLYEDIMPKLPLRAHGEAWHTGWDIPTRWAIDASGTCWMDSAHGGAMSPVSKESLIGTFEDEHDRNNVRRHLGLAEEEPSWMRAARAAGWTPPK